MLKRKAFLRFIKAFSKSAVTSASLSQRSPRALMTSAACGLREAGGKARPPWGKAPLVGSPAGYVAVQLAAPRASVFSLSQVAHLRLKRCCMGFCSFRRKSNGRRRFRSGTGSSLLFMSSPLTARPGLLLAFIRTRNLGSHKAPNKTLPGEAALLSLMHRSYLRCFNPFKNGIKKQELNLMTFAWRFPGSQRGKGNQ